MAGRHAEVLVAGADWTGRSDDVFKDFSDWIMDEEKQEEGERFDERAGTKDEYYQKQNNDKGNTGIENGDGVRICKGGGRSEGRKGNTD